MGTDGWVWAMTLDGKGGGSMMEPWDPLAWNLMSTNPLGGSQADLFEASPVPPEAQGGCWLHLDLAEPKAISFLKETEKWSSSRADRRAIRLATRRLTTLLETDQPRFLVQRAGDEPTNPASAINVSLRSLQHVPASGSSPSSYKAVVLRLRLSATVLLSARIKGLAGLSQHPELRLDLLNGAGAHSPGGLFASIVEIVVRRCHPAVQALDEAIFKLRETLQRVNLKTDGVSSDELVSMRQTLAPLRQDTIWMLRYLRPQLQALEGLQRWSETEASIHGGQELLSADALARCREARFRLASLVAELEAHDASGAVLHDELVALASEQIGQSDNIIAKLGLALSLLVCVQLGLDITMFAHSAGLIDLNAAFPDGRFPEKEGDRAPLPSAALQQQQAAAPDAAAEQQPERGRRGFRWLYGY